MASFSWAGHQDATGELRSCLERATALLQVQGSYALRSQAQQQAALELLQARKLGARDPLLETVLLSQIRASLADLLAKTPGGADGTPCPPESIFSLAELDAWVLPRSLRRYQLLIVDQIPFALKYEDEIFDFLYCHTSESVNRLQFRRRSDGAQQQLITDSCGSGFSLEGRTPVPLEGFLPRNSSPTGPPLLRAGDPNFAHFIWNELDPLLYLAQQAQQRGERLPVVQDSCSILDLADLPGIVRLPKEHLQIRSSVHVGAMWVSALARDTVLTSLGAPRAAVRDRTGQPPLLLLGVRGPGRRELLGEVELLIALIRRLKHRWPALRIALDGFTLQRNHGQDPVAISRADAIGERIRRIQAACVEWEIESLHEISFASYLPRAAEASFYVTHEGTIQHKIGWLYPEVPGICLVAGPHARAIADWHLLQCEGAGRLDVLPLGLLEHRVGDEGTPPGPELRNQAFHATDPTAVLEAIEALLAPHLDASIAAYLDAPIAAHQDDQLEDPPPHSTDVVSAVWLAEDPLAALRAFERSQLPKAGECRETLFRLCDAALLTNHRESLEAAARNLSHLPGDDLWVCLYRLRVERIRGGESKALRSRALALLPDAASFDLNSRSLLASLLGPDIELETLSRLLPELPREGLALMLHPQKLESAAATAAAAQLLEQSGKGEPEERERAARLYGALGESLRRPFQPWDSPEAGDPSRIEGVVAMIDRARREGRGFGLIRLGDGEGCFLSGLSTDLEGATRNGDRVDPELARRGGHLIPEAFDALREHFRQALQRVDLVGIPDLWQCVQGPDQALKVAAHLDADEAALVPGGWHLHLQMLRHGSFQRSPFDQIDAVIGAALPPVLKGTDVAFVPLPGEDPHWRGSDRPNAHYPTVYLRVLEWIDAHVRPGQLVLVGGGLLGKIYVEAIRSRDGVGIDVGSVIDLCCGHTGHRGEHRLNPYLSRLAAQAFQQVR